MFVPCAFVDLVRQAGVLDEITAVCPTVSTVEQTLWHIACRRILSLVVDILRDQIGKTCIEKALLGFQKVCLFQHLRNTLKICLCVLYGLLSNVNLRLHGLNLLSTSVIPTRLL